MLSLNIKKIGGFLAILLIFIFLITIPKNINQQTDSPNIKIGDSQNYATFDIKATNQIDLNQKAYIVKTKELEQKIETQTNRKIQDYIWVETNDYVPKNTGGTITLTSIGRKTFKCDGTVDNPNCFEITSCGISQKPCYEFNDGKTIIYVNHFSGAFNTMTWTTNDDWNTGTHVNTTNSTNNLVLSGTNTIGSYTSNTTTTTYAITRIKPIWNSTDSWKYKKEINISNTGSALTEYQVNLTITKETEMNTDYSDLRFKDTSQNTIPFWIETYNANNATVWIKTNLSASTNTTILMYYGNTKADNSSNVSEVMIYDDFNVSTLNLDLWDEITGLAGYTISGGILTLQAPFTVAFQGGLMSKSSINGPHILETRVQFVNDNNNAIFGMYLNKTDGRDSAGYHMYHWESNNQALRIIKLDNSELSRDYVTQTESYITYKYINDGTNIEHFYNGVSQGSLTGYTELNNGDLFFKSAGYIAGSYDGNINIDYIHIRKYTATEPTISSISTAVAGDYRGLDGQNYTVEISADNGANWITTTNNTNYTSSAGIGTGTNILYRINLSTNNSDTTPKLHDITLDYDTDMSIPTIAFVPPTEDNDSSINTDYTYINVTIMDNTNTTAFIDWNNSLVGWWRFNNNIDFTDYSSYSNDGTNQGSIYIESGKFGGARNFNGEAYVTVTDDNSLDITDSITVSAWVNINEDTDTSQTYTINGEQLTKRKLITINGSMVTTETNIPLMLRTKLPGVKAGGADVRLAKLDGTPLPREIEWVWDNDDVVLHYPFNTTVGADSQFYVYWGNASLNEPVSSSTYGSQAVWDENYVGVWHMNNDPSVGAPQLLDSTSNGNDGTSGGAMVSEDLIDGDYGKGIDFDGINDEFNIPDSSTFPSIDVTDSGITFQYLYYKRPSTYVEYFTKGRQPDGVSYLPMIEYKNGITRLTSSVSASVYNFPPPSDYSRNIISSSSKNLGNGNDQTDIYVNDDAVDSESLTHRDYDNTYPLLFGRRDSTTIASRWMSFIVYEVRLSNITRSANHISTTHNNLNNPTTNGTDPFYLDRIDDTQKYTAKSNSTGTTSEFLRRQPLTITTNGSATPADYQVKVTVPYKSAMNIDFSDVRFNTDADGSGTYIDYWVENKTNSITADIWLELPNSITDGSSDTVYMFYGNSSLSNESNGSNTFQEFWDFEDGTLQGFTAQTSTAITSSISNRGTYSIDLYDNSASGGQWGALYRTDFNYQTGVLEYDMYRTPTTNVYYGLHLRDGGLSGTVIVGTYVQITDESLTDWSSVDFSGGEYITPGNQWVKMSMSFDQPNTVLSATVDGTYLGTSTSIGAGTIDTLLFNSGTSAGIGRYGYLDDIRLRKYIANEPTTSFGAETAPDPYFAISDSSGNVNVFTRKKQITLNHSGALTDYQTKLNITYESEMLSNFDDIRFVTASGAYIPYWIENKTDSATADVWIKNNLTDGNTTIWLYYGNDGLSNGNNIDDVMIFGDDFDIDDGGWVNTSEVTLSVSDSTLTTSWTGLGSNDYTKGVLHTQSMPARDYIIEYKSKTSGTLTQQWHGVADQINIVGSGTDRVNHGYYTNRRYYAMSKNNSVAYEFATSGSPLFSDNMYSRQTVHYIPSIPKVEWFVDGSSITSTTDSSKIPTTSITMYPVLSANRNAAQSVTFDWFIVREYTATEPIATIGQEQSSTQTSILSKESAYSLGANTTNAFATINGETITAPISAGWNHIAITYDKDTSTPQMKLYVNDIEETTTDYSIAITTNTNNIIIGQSLNGTIDEVRIYNRALSEEEINASYNTGLYRLETNITNLTEGTYEYTAYAQDLAGNVNQTETRTLTITSGLDCGTLSTPNTIYTLTQNVSSAGTCFTIGADNITLDGAGYTINYSKEIVGSGVNITGYNNITIKNLNIIQENISVWYVSGIYLNQVKDALIFNNSIKTTGHYSPCIKLYGASTNNNNVTSNTCSVPQATGGAGIVLDYARTNNYILNNIIDVKSTSDGIQMYNGANSNSFLGNIITFDSGKGISVGLSENNTISGGSVSGSPGYDYYIISTDTNTNITNTNFTTSRKIYFGSATTYFNYNNETDGNIWLKTNVSAQSTITRNLVNWSQPTMTWNDTNSTAGIITRYNLTGLIPSTIYSIYNTSSSGTTTQYLATDSVGILPSFTIALNSNTEIKVIDDNPPDISFISPTEQDGSAVNHNWTYVNTTIEDAYNSTVFIDWNNSLVGWWRFEELSGSTIYDDSSYKHNLTCTNCPERVSGTFGKGLFSEYPNYYQMSNTDALNLKGSLTLETWINLNGISYDGFHSMISKRSYNFFASNSRNGRFELRNELGTIYTLLTQKTLEYNQWYHLVGVFNNTDKKMKVYVNGVFDNEKLFSGTILDSSDRILRFGRFNAGSQSLNGTIDEVKIWNRALSEEEINASYNAGLYRLETNFTDLTDGTYEYTAYAQDLAGNVNQTETRTLTVDTTDPFIEFIDPTADNNTYQKEDYTYINTTVSDANPNTTAFIDWNRSLVGWWRMDNNTGTNLKDYSSYNNDGTLKNMNVGSNNCTGNCSGWTTSGKFGYGMYFDGIDDIITKTDNSNLDIPIQTDGKITMEAWVYPFSLTYETGIISKRQNYRMVLRAGGELKFQTFGWTGAGTSVSANKWSHIATTYDGEIDQLKFYINGINVRTVSGYIVNGGLNGNELYIGKGHDLTNSFNGTIDEVKIYNRTLTPEEINASYNAGLYRLETNIINIPEGTYNYTAYAQDMAGNTNQTETRILTIDTTPPQITIYEPANATTNDNTPHINATQQDANPIDSMWYSIDGGANIYGSWTNEIDTSTTTLSEGTHYITIYANDSAGNQNQTTQYFEVDALPPVITIISPPAELHGGDVWLNISLDQRVSWCGYSINGATNITMSNTTLIDYKKLEYGLSQNIHTVTFYCNNTYGLMSSTSKNVNNTEGFVVIKLTGSGFTPTQNTNNKYITTSFADGTTVGIIHTNGIYESMSSSTTHLELRQKTLLHGNTSKAYIVYTKGNAETYGKRISQIKNGNINHISNPSFAYGIDKKYKIQVGLEYTDIDLNRSLKLTTGFHNIRLKHTGLRNDKIVMDITRTY